MSAVLASVLLAGCSAGSEGSQSPDTDTSSTQTAPSEPTPEQSSRTAPVKSLEIGDQCSVLSEAQAQELGADQAPRARESNGRPGCNYALGQAGTKFSVFVSVDKTETMKKLAAGKPGSQPTEVAGYPAVEVGIKTNCIVSLDISDQGQLFVNSSVSSGDPNPCDLAKRFAEAAVNNLPNG
ncbi:DUF3558 domain-containing protein [Saccharopolyspora sp. NPDC002686]|uniref:DUF3558 domain-containing protein n=1 Tax=Saccharopolyspora sp. NPDC002686 TaxID=3154541 RepID=UPI00331BD5BC